MHAAALPETTTDRGVLKGPVGRTHECLMCVYGGSGLKPEGSAEEQAEQSLVLDSYLRVFQIFQHQNPHFSISHTRNPTHGNDGSDNWV